MKKKSIYKYASEAGLPAGIYLTIMSACLLLSTKLPALPTLILPLGIGFPVLLWALMRKIAKAEPVYLKFSSMWLAGIYTVIFGSIICLFFSALYIVFIEPGFVGHYVNNAIAAVEQTPMAGEYEATISLMREAIEAKILPSGMEFITMVAWLTCFSGSLLSLFLALILTKGSGKIERQTSF